MLSQKLLQHPLSTSPGQFLQLPALQKQPQPVSEYIHVNKQFVTYGKHLHFNASSVLRYF